MDTLIEKLLTTGGPMGVLVVVVFMFLKAIREMGQEHRAWMDQTIKNTGDRMEVMNREHLEARRITDTCIASNTAAMEKNTVAMANVSVAVAACPLRHES